MPSSTTKLYDRKGRRKYLTHSERERFLKAADSLSPERRAFCLVLLFAGCRISEALQLTVERIDWERRALVMKTLKRRDPDEQRVIFIPPTLLGDLRAIIGEEDGKIWTFSRRTGWRIVKAVMKEAKIEGTQACPKGLRHGFGMANAEEGTPTKGLAEVMGHSDEETTMIYQDPVDEELRRFLEKTWLGY